MYNHFKNMLRNFPKICLIFSLLVLSYTGFKSEIIFEGRNRDYYLIYYLLSIIFIILSIILFYLNNIIKLYLIITISTILICLYAIEGFISHYGKIDFIQLIKKSKMYSKETGKKFDTRSTITIYNELKKLIKILFFQFSHNFLKKRVFILYLEYQIQKLFFVMKMDIKPFTKVIDMDSIIPMINGIIKK